MRTRLKKSIFCISNWFPMNWNPFRIHFRVQKRFGSLFLRCTWFGTKHTMWVLFWTSWSNIPIGTRTTFKMQHEKHKKMILSRSRCDCWRAYTSGLGDFRVKKQTLKTRGVHTAMRRRLHLTWLLLIYCSPSMFQEQIELQCGRIACRTKTSFLTLGEGESKLGNMKTFCAQNCSHSIYRDMHILGSNSISAL